MKLYLTHRGEPELARIVLDDGAIVLCLRTRCPRTGDVTHRDWQPGYPGDEIADVAECGTPDGYESGEAMRAAYDACWDRTLPACDPPELTDWRAAR